MGRRDAKGRLMWSLRVQSLYAPGRTAKGALDLVECRANRIGKITVNATKWSLLVLFLGSVALTSTGFSVKLNQPLPGIGIVLVALTIVPALFQTLDWLWRDAPIGGYRRVFDRLNKRFTQYIKRRMTARVLARYGGQALARRILTRDKAEKFTVAAYIKRSRRRRQATLVVCVLAIAGGISYSALANHSTPHYHVGQQIMIDSIFSATALTSPACALSKTSEATPLCSVEVRFRNVSHFPYLLGIGSFTAAGPNGSDESSGVYAVSLINHGNYYYFFTASLASGDSNVQPDQAVTFNLYFGVPVGIHPDELLLKSEISGTSVRIDFP
jgi:hypothetical protein